MTQNQNESEVSIKEQIKKFMVKGFYGFNTIITFGLGRRLGIFDYLYEKSMPLSESKTISSITFTPEELSENLNLSLVHIDAWVHMALECGIFEIDNQLTRSIKTAPHVFNLLVNRDHMFYIGDPMGLFYYMAPLQDFLIDVFKTGKMDIDLLPEEILIAGQRASSKNGELTERVFSKKYRDFCRGIKKQGTVLTVGCGYGFNLEKWARKYKRARFVGIDIDPKGIESSKKMIKNHNWSDRVEVFEIPVNDYSKKTEFKFDLIILNQVLHEMDKDEEYRKRVFEDLYAIMKDNGILLVGETMVPDTFAPKQRPQLFEIMHKVLEAGFARFYDETSFKELISLTPFKNAELTVESGASFWVVRK
ncbi:hypothetical protein LCGC14_1412700 [marine sediment metagenome]|uniref:Methyltransferase type 12 domain-containing protein n=1 Tax=marine sediment metagenome TaxID=412755 RepID=A0A0F9M959_9ZZZZ